jgi:HEAT repeat protein
VHYGNYRKKIEKWIDKKKVQSLITSLDDDDIDVRYSAAQALGRIGDIRAVEPLIKAFGNDGDDEGVRHSAAAALGTIGGNEAEKALKKIKIK